MDEDDEYPSEADLTALEQFEGTPRHFVDEVIRLWAYPSYTTVTTITDDFGKEVLQLRLATGGWSGNEDVIQAIDAGMFRILYWHLSQRGGLHLYRIPVARLDEPVSFGLPATPVLTSEWGTCDPEHGGGPDFQHPSEKSARDFAAEQDFVAVVRETTPWRPLTPAA